ncbi:MAG TPA: response regulator transcription factor [Dehalococcoidia bacterium]|nr:response regulator transcription factor [Dehalococcoidia bacterium]
MAFGSMLRILLIDDDPHLLDALSRVLSLEGFDVELAKDAGEALNLTAHSKHDVIVLDVMMPTVDGFTLCRLLRDRIEAPILMLTALDSVTDRVTGLEAGADDYLTKPFATSELVARIKVLLRRTQASGSKDGHLQFGGLTLNSTRWEALRNGKPLNLRSKEFRILQILMAAPGRVFTRQEILELAWEREEAIESNVVDVHVASLRQRIEADGGTRLIQTVRGVGYTLRES